MALYLPLANCPVLLKSSRPTPINLCNLTQLELLHPLHCPFGSESVRQGWHRELRTWRLPVLRSRTSVDCLEDQRQRGCICVQPTINGSGCRIQKEDGEDRIARAPCQSLYVGFFLLSILDLIPKSFVLIERPSRHCSFLFSSIACRALGTFTLHGECIV
jgi:hypothetical protein